jgi:hypothetical protein
VLDTNLYKALGLRPAFFFDKETFGTDRLLAGDLREDAFLAAAPVSDAVRRDHKRLLTSTSTRCRASASPRRKRASRV